jgi:site-specific DNA-methyltransferase (adenine-specific)
MQAHIVDKTARHATNESLREIVMAALVGDRDRHQWFTPAWAAQALVEAHFGNLTDRDVVMEPTCGTGNFLAAIPPHVRAFGIELDGALAQAARELTGRDVVCGDVLTAEFPEDPTAVVGNPPFDLDIVDALLDRCHRVLPQGGRVGLILPAYAFQTASRVVGYARRWSLAQDMIPRNIFPGMSKPLTFAVFSKDGLGTTKGFALYRELDDVRGMHKWVADELDNSAAPWPAVVKRALRELGGEAPLEDIYAAVAPRRPTQNRWWRAKVRQTLGRSDGFERVGQGRWALAA